MKAVFVGGNQEGRRQEIELLVADKVIDGEQYRAWIETKEGLRPFIHGESRIKCRFVIYALPKFEAWQIVQKLIEGYQPNTYAVGSSWNGKGLEEPGKWHVST